MLPAWAALDDRPCKPTSATADRRGHDEPGIPRTQRQSSEAATFGSDFKVYVVHVLYVPCSLRVGSTGVGAARLGFRDCSWGNYKYPLPPQFTPVQRQAAVDGHRRDLLDDVETMQRARLQLRGRRLGCWCAPEPCHGHNLSWVANCEESVFRQLLRAAPPSRDLGSGRRGWDPGG